MASFIGNEDILGRLSKMGNQMDIGSIEKKQVMLLFFTLCVLEKSNF